MGLAAGKLILAIQKERGEFSGEPAAQKVLDRARTLLQASESSSVLNLLDGRPVIEYLGAEWVETHPPVKLAVEALVIALTADEANIKS